MLILDEAFAGLDVTVQAGIVALLRDLRAREGLTLVSVSHDLALLAALADTVAVIDGGRVVGERPGGGDPGRAAPSGDARARGGRWSTCPRRAPLPA